MITANYKPLLHQASHTANQYFINAIDAIDKQFGEGYAKAHPELVSKFMEVAAHDFRTSMTVKTIEEQVERILEKVACFERIQ